MESKERKIYVALGVVGLMIIVLLLGTVIVLSLSGRNGAPVDAGAQNYGESDHYGANSADIQDSDENEYTDDDFMSDSEEYDAGLEESPSEEYKAIVKESTPAATTTPATKQKDTAENSQSESPEKGSTGQTYKIGSTVDMNGVKLTLNKAYTTKDINILLEPEEGYEYIVTNWTCENATGSELYFDASTNFTAYVDDVKLKDEWLLSDSDLMFLTLNDGRKATGNVIYEIPEDWEVFEVEVRDSLWSSGDPYVFKLKNK